MPSLKLSFNFESLAVFVVFNKYKMFALMSTNAVKIKVIIVFCPIALIL